MAIDVYDLGDAPTITAVFKNLAGAETDTTVAVTHREPDKTESSITPANTAVGTYTATTEIIDQTGTHIIKFFGTGIVVAAEEITFRIRDTDVGT